MVGREVKDVFPQRTHEIGDVAMSVDGLTVYSADDPTKALVRRRQFLCEKRRGSWHRRADGCGTKRIVDGDLRRVARQKLRKRSLSTASAVEIKSSKSAIDNGIGFVTEDRKKFGLILPQTIADNMTLAALPSCLGQFSDQPVS